MLKYNEENVTYIQAKIIMQTEVAMKKATWKLYNDDRKKFQ